jgi:putative ABC transport system ATP-binding protein
MKPLVRIAALSKVYHSRQVSYEALRDVSLDIAAGDFVAIMGPSGSGKSTLLHLVGGLDRPSQGTIQVGEHTLNRMNETALARFRRAHIGFVFQFFNLIDNLSVRANIELPALLLRKRHKRSVRGRSDELLQRLGIADQARKHPWELSGGQQQRVAIARALVNQPTLLLADEPTGNLDSASGQQVLDILSESNRMGQTVLMVTHDAFAAAGARQVLFIHDGQLVDRVPGGDVSRITQRLTELKSS